MVSVKKEAGNTKENFLLFTKQKTNLKLTFVHLEGNDAI